MIDRLLSVLVVLTFDLLAVGQAEAANSALTIRWAALRPAVQAAFIETRADAASIAANGTTLSQALDGKTINLAGYVLPVDRDGDLVYEFLLLPITGLCSHVAAPAPNQIVHVFPDHPYKLAEIYDAVAITGMLKPEIERTQLFILDGISSIESGYSVTRAQVRPVEQVPDTAPQPGVTPWKFLRN